MIVSARCTILSAMGKLTCNVNLSIAVDLWNFKFRSTDFFLNLRIVDYTINTVYSLIISGGRGR